MPSPTPYTLLTLSDFISQVLDLMDDLGGVYWKRQEVQFAAYEALLYWGATTNYWRNRGTFSAGPQSTSFTSTNAFVNAFDLSVTLPQYRTRNTTIDQMVREIQYMLLENPSGLSGSGMSGQTTVSSILSAIIYGVNRFILDVRFPVVSDSVSFGFDETSGVYQLDDRTVYLHRLCYQTTDGQYTPLWRMDTWSIDKGDPGWTTTPNTPFGYSESQLAPLQVQLIPSPIAQAKFLYASSVLSYSNDSPLPGDILPIPNEWVHAVKYAALSQILSNPSQIADPMRSQYAENRYQQSVKFARDARSITRAVVNGVPLPLCPITDLDAGYPAWMNSYGPPFLGGVMYDYLFLASGRLDGVYGIGVDVVSAAPLPALNDFMPVGDEEIDNLKDYVSHILSFKCGGKDFTSTVGNYDSYMQCAGKRGAINAAKIQYLTPILGQPQLEWAERPDKVMSND